MFYDRLPLLYDVDTRTSSDSRLLSITDGLEIGKAFQSVDFAVAMPFRNSTEQAEKNAAIAAAVQELKRGSAVYL